MKINQQMNFEIHLPPSHTYHILFNLINIHVFSEPIIDNILSNVILKVIISGNIMATIGDHLPQFLISSNVFPDLPSDKLNIFETDLSNFD